LSRALRWMRSPTRGDPSGIILDIETQGPYAEPAQASTVWALWRCSGTSTGLPRVDHPPETSPSQLAAAADSKPLSQIVPVLTGPTICDVAVQDPGSGKWNLIGLFSNVNANRFPTQQPLTVFMQLNDAQGLYKIEVRFIQLDTGAELGRAEIDLEVADRLSSPTIALAFPPLPIPKAGEYEFQTWSNGAFLGSTTLTARGRPRPRQ